MSVHADVNSLRAEIARSISVLAKIERYFIEFQQKRLSAHPDTDDAMVIAQSLTNYYTCLETLFLRISQFFENGLEQGRWHRSLLNKMVLEIPHTRPRVISDATCMTLGELLKFRHFTRYYFELEYDWDKLRYLIKKFNDVHDVVKDEIAAFDRYLAELAEEKS